MAISVVVPKADTITDKALIASAARATSDVTSDFGVDNFSAAEVYVLCSAASGTSPTLDVYIQKRLPDGVTYDDIAHFSQFTGAAKRVLSFVNGGNTLNTEGDAALAANTVNTVALGGWWRIKFVIAGTNPSFTFGVYANFRA